MNRETELYQLQDMIRQINSLNNKCEANMKALNQMMLELKGIVAMVRPNAKKNAWYGEEVSATPITDSIQIEKDNIQIEYESIK